MKLAITIPAYHEVTKAEWLHSDIGESLIPFQCQFKKTFAIGNNHGISKVRKSINLLVILAFYVVGFIGRDGTVT